MAAWLEALALRSRGVPALAWGPCAPAPWPSPAVLLADRCSSPPAPGRTGSSWRPPASGSWAPGKSTEVRATPYERNGRPIPDPPVRLVLQRREGGEGRRPRERRRRGLGRRRGAPPSAAPSARQWPSCRCRSGWWPGSPSGRSARSSRWWTPPRRSRLEVEAFDDLGAKVAAGRRSSPARARRSAAATRAARCGRWGPARPRRGWSSRAPRRRVPVRVVEGRSADARPQAVKGNPMEEIERQYEGAGGREKAAEGGEEEVSYFPDASFSASAA